MLSPEEREVTVGSDQATFLCQYSSVISSTVTWLKDEEDISLELGITIETTNDNNSVLIISNPSTTDSGVYSCVVNNSIGERNKTAILTVGKQAYNLNII